jgi:3-deoxy-7-phosphoheptulonate synthase
MCDPMHGNTKLTTAGLKTRDFQTILREIVGFFRVHDAERTWAGGLHFEMSGRHVTECIGGHHALSEADLGERYETTCDPRLNPDQATELARLVAEELRQRHTFRRRISAQLVAVESTMSNRGRLERPAPHDQRPTLERALQ